MAARLLLAFGSILRLASAASECPPDAKPFFQPPQGTSLTIRYAQLFTVTYYSTYKVIKYHPTLGTYSPSWPNADERGQKLPDHVLYKCGTERPTPLWEGVEEDATFFSIPLQKAVIGWSGVLHFFELLSVTEAIHGISMTYISSPCIQLLHVCYPSIHATGGSHGDGVPGGYDDLAAGAQAVFTDSFGSGWSNTSKDVYFEISFESGLVHQAEWIKFVAVFFNLEAEAEAIFNQIDFEYLWLKNHAVQLAASAFDSGKPHVAFVTKSDWVQLANGTWCNTCGGAYRFSNSHAKRDMVEDAGGELLQMPAQVPAEGCQFLTNTDGSPTYQCSAAGLPAFRDLLAQADVIFDETYVFGHGPYGLQDFISSFQLEGMQSDVRAMVNSAVFRSEGQVSDPFGDRGDVGNSLHEQMKAQPHQLLSDMMKAFYGDAFNGPCDMTYLRGLYVNTEQTSLSHTDCPLHDEGGLHDCEAIHDVEHEVPLCSIQTAIASTPAPEEPTDGAHSTDSQLSLVLTLLGCTAAYSLPLP